MSPKKREYLSTHSPEDWSSPGAGSSAEAPTYAMTSSEAGPEQLAMAQLAKSRNRPMRRSCSQNDQVRNNGATQGRKYQEVHVRFSFPNLHTAVADILPILEHSIRLYFAPISGALKGIRQEYRRLNRTERVRHGGARHRR